MRSTISIIVGFLVLFSISIFITGQIDRTADTIMLQLDKAEVLIAAEKWDEAETIINSTYENWLTAKNWLAIVLNHSTLSNIEISYKRLQQFSLTKEKALSLAELNTLKIMLEDIPESEALRLNNIL